VGGAEWLSGAWKVYYEGSGPKKAAHLKLFQKKPKPGFCTNVALSLEKQQLSLVSVVFCWKGSLAQNFFKKIFKPIWK